VRLKKKGKISKFLSSYRMEKRGFLNLKEEFEFENDFPNFEKKFFEFPFRK